MASLVAKALLAVALLSTLAPSLCAGMITELKVEHDDRAIVLIARPFGFNKPDGTIEITVKSPKVFLPEQAPPADKNKLGFFLTASSEVETTQLVNSLSDGACALDVEAVHNKLFTFQDISDNKNESQGDEYTHRYRFAPEKTGEYSLFFANCEPKNTVVSFDIVVALSNPAGAGSSTSGTAENTEEELKDLTYLSAGEQVALPALYAAMCALYLCAGTLWLFTVHRAPPQGRHKIHYHMCAPIFCKCLALLMQSIGYFHMMGARGSSPCRRCFVAHCVFNGGAFVSTAIILFGTGFLFLIPALSDFDRLKKILCVVLPLQMFVNVAARVNVGGRMVLVPPDRWYMIEGGLDWPVIVFLVFNMACYCAVVFPVARSIQQMREDVETQPPGGDGAHGGALPKNNVGGGEECLSRSEEQDEQLGRIRRMNKMILFWQFYVLVMVYKNLAPIVVYLIKSTTTQSTSLLWLPDAAAELATLIFFGTAGYMFRPVSASAADAYVELDEMEDMDGGVRRWLGLLSERPPRKKTNNNGVEVDDNNTTTTRTSESSSNSASSSRQLIQHQARGGQTGAGQKTRQTSIVFINDV